MSNKTLLIVERAESKLQSVNEDEKYVLEGTFSEVGVKNNNNRIYDEKELIPHIDELKKQCVGNKLLGELDHPKSFDISLQTASHIIESIDYNPETKKVIGRIRLLNTDAGRNARALVDAGVPLHISSRAAGQVESNGHVKIKKMFTYDLVATPGFSNAELKRVNESYGFGEDDNLGLFEIPGNWDFENGHADKIEENKTNENKSNNGMDKDKFISIDDFNQYTKLVKNEFENLKKSMNESSTNDKVDDGIVRYTESIAKKVNTLQETISRLTENVDGLVSHNDYIIENLEKVKDYAELVGEKSNIGINYSEKLSESVDHLIEYTKIVAEKTDQGIEYTKTVAEKTDQGIEYTKMVAEKADQGIEYTKMLAEKTNQAINHIDYVAEETSQRWKYQSEINENLDNVISHNDYIVEGHDSVIKYTEHIKEHTENLSKYVGLVVERINEGMVVESTKAEDKVEDKVVIEKPKTLNESLNVNTEDNFESDITTQLNSILESAKSEVESNEDKTYHFFNFLGEAKKREFDAFNEETKTKILEAFKNNSFYGSSDALKIWESCFINESVKIDWLANMPSKYVASWNSLNESQKHAIKAQASTKVLETQYQIDNFWGTRDLRVEKSDIVNEGLTAPINENSNYESSNEYMDAVRAGFRARFKR